MPKLTSSFSRLRDAELLTKAQHVVDCVTGNANFPDPTPTMADLQTSVNAFATANANSSNNTKEGTVVKQKAREKVEADLGDLALYVQLKSKGDTAIMLSSGFDIRKASSPIGILDKPHDLRIKSVDGMSGSAKLTVAAVENASGYLWMYTEAPATATSVWLPATSNAPNVSINGLKPRTDYVFNVAATATDPARVFSDNVTAFVM